MTGRKAFLVAANIAAPLSASVMEVVVPTVLLEAVRSVRGRNFLVIISESPFDPPAFDLVDEAVGGPPDVDATRVERVVRVGKFSIGAEDVLAAVLLRADALVGMPPPPLDDDDLGGILNTICCLELIGRVSC